MRGRATGGSADPPAAWIPYAAVYEAAKMAGLIAGINHRRLPVAVKRRFSALPASDERSRNAAAHTR